MCRAIQNLPNPVLSTPSFVQASLSILNQLHEFNNDFKYFIYVCKVLKLRTDEPPSHKNIPFLTLN